MHGINKRQLRLIEIVKSRKGIQSIELAEILNVCKRTILYDLEFIKAEYGNVIEVKRGHNGGIFWIDSK